MAQQTRSLTSDIPTGIFVNGPAGTGSHGRTGAMPLRLDYLSGFIDGTAAGQSMIASAVSSASDVDARILPDARVEISWSYPDDIAAQGIVFDVYQSLDPTDLFRSAAATSVAALSVQLAAAPLVGDRYFAVIARRRNALALPSRPVLLTVPPLATAPPPTAVSAVRALTPTGVGFPFGITPTGSVFAQGGDDLLRGRILQLLLTSPGERVNRPDFGTRLLDLVFDPNSEVLAATMEFTITRSLQQEFGDEIQLDAVQLTASDETLLVDISYLRKSDLRLEQLTVGVPLAPGAPP